MEEKKEMITTDNKSFSRNLRYCIGNAIKKEYGDYSEKSISDFQSRLGLSNGCLDNLSGGGFTISTDDLKRICAYLNPPQDLAFYWIKHYGKTENH